MSEIITVINNSSGTIYVSVTALGSTGNENWWPIAASGGQATWTNRSWNQVVRFTRSTNPGARIETVLGIPGQAVNIY